ncbi:MAG: hypothetical protein Q4F80_05280, partial [bacterium]|nr:hypothetical protein [bacterium]
IVLMYFPSSLYCIFSIMIYNKNKFIEISQWIKERILYKNPEIYICAHNAISETGCGGCGSFGLNSNTDNTTKPPCLVVVDVNGDRKPNPQNANCKDTACGKDNKFKFSDPEGKRLTDMFSVMITDKGAIPYGIAAQRAMYNSQK